MHTQLADWTDQAERGLPNSARRAIWRARWRASQHEEPAHANSVFAVAIRAWLCPWLQPSLRRSRACNTATNSNRCKMPRYRGQYQHASLPTRPEVA